MNIIEKTEGTKISHSIMGDTILVLEEELYLNLEKYQRDYPVHIDISRNEFNMLVMGTSREYVAQIDIPEKTYRMVDTGEITEEGTPIMEKVHDEFDMNTVTLTLWGGNANV